MKIALMTWFHYINYGTALQVYASTKYLEEKGNEVYVIQYYPNPSPMYFSSKSSEYLYRAKRKLHKISTSKGILDETCSESFHNFISSSIRLTEKVQNESDFAALNSKFDCFICGSDQIWSPLNYDQPYFLDFVSDTDKMVAYAPSLGVSHIDRPGDDKKISELANRFKYLSVREKTGAELIRKLNGREARVVLDPTLLLDKDDWNRLVPGEAEGRPYVLAYFLRENKKYWKAVSRSHMTPSEAQDILSDYSPDPGTTCVANNKLDPQFDLQIIVPAYNAEKFVAHCLESTLHQDTKYSYLITVVNDGSTDRTPEIIESYHVKFPDRIEVINQENKGFSGAKNAALRVLKGRYITFLDSDDVLGEGAVQTLLTEVYMTDADIVQGGWITNTEFRTLVQTGGGVPSTIQKHHLAIPGGSYIKQKYLSIFSSQKDIGSRIHQFLSCCTELDTVQRSFQIWFMATD